MHILLVLTLGPVSYAVDTSVTIMTTICFSVYSTEKHLQEDWQSIHELICAVITVMRAPQPHANSQEERQHRAQQQLLRKVYTFTHSHTLTHTLHTKHFFRYHTHHTHTKHTHAGAHMCTHTHLTHTGTHTTHSTHVT